MPRSTTATPTTPDPDAAELGRLRWQRLCETTEPRERSELMRSLAQKVPKGSEKAAQRALKAWETKRAKAEAQAAAEAAALIRKSRKPK
jgi:hypothetical protein